MNSPDYSFKQYDTGRQFEAQLLTSTAPYEPVDLTGKTAFLDWRKQGSPDSAAVSLELTVDPDPLTGIVRRWFQPADVAVHGMYEANIRIVDGVHGPSRFPNDGCFLVLIDKAIKA